MKKIIQTYDAPSAIGTYNQAVKYKGFIYTSGQLGIDPHTTLHDRLGRPLPLVGAGSVRQELLA